MKPILSLFSLLLAAVPAYSAPKSVKKVPTPIPSLSKLGSSITLAARGVAAARTEGTGTAPSAGSTRVTTGHDHSLEITVGNLASTPSPVTLRWFWVGRYERSKNWFRTGEDSKALTLDPKKSEIVLTDETKVESHDTKGKSGSYKSGGSIAGWVVIAVDSSNQIKAVKTSDPLLEGFATTPPPKVRYQTAAE